MTLIRTLPTTIEERIASYYPTNPPDYIDDGQGGLLSLADLWPVQQIGKDQPTAYIHRVTGRMFQVGPDTTTTPEEVGCVGYDELA